VYPSEPPTLNERDRKKLQAPLGYYRKDGRFDYVFRQSYIPKDNFEWYLIYKKRTWRRMIKEGNVK
jgi:hypothetical protein